MFKIFLQSVDFVSKAFGTNDLKRDKKELNNKNLEENVKFIKDQAEEISDLAEKTAKLKDNINNKEVLKEKEDEDKVNNDSDLEKRKFIIVALNDEIVSEMNNLEAQNDLLIIDILLNKDLDINKLSRNRTSKYLDYLYEIDGQEKRFLRYKLYGNLKYLLYELDYESFSKKYKNFKIDKPNSAEGNRVRILIEDDSDLNETKVLIEKAFEDLY